MSTQVVTPSPTELMRAYNETEAPRISADLEAEKKAAEALFTLPADVVEAPYVTLCSIWPEPLDSQPFHHNGVGRKIYSLAAGSPETPAYCLLKNVWDWITVQEGVGEKGYQQVTVTAGQIAIDLIKHWTGDHPANRRGKRGIGIIRGEFNPQTKRFEATAEEISILEKQQRGFLGYIVERCDQAWDSGKREYGFSEGRKALKMLGLDINQHLWYRSKVQLYNECPNCAEKVQVNAIYCKICHQSITEYFMNRDLIPDKAQWPKVVEDMERLTKGKKSK